VRFAIETWAPDYGSPVDDAVLADSDAPVDLGIERDPAQWAPLSPAVGPAACVSFVDGVQRVDAWVWIAPGGSHGDTDDDSVGVAAMAHQGVCASWAAGVVRCDASARVVAAEVRRGVLCPGVTAETISTHLGDYRPYPVPASGGDPLSQALGQHRGELEGRVAAAAGTGELLVVDGPLGDRRHVAGAVGYVKTHRVAYLPAGQQGAVGALASGERTPLFTIGDRRFRYSWYIRLPGRATHPWWGVVRCEASGDLAPADAAALADRVTATLPRFASQPHNDPRAPQNLHPIAGLERELRRRLGDPALLERALRLEAAQPA
jgi:hypothetical protein